MRVFRVAAWSRLPKVLWNVSIEIHGPVKNPSDLNEPHLNTKKDDMTTDRSYSAFGKQIVSLTEILRVRGNFLEFRPNRVEVFFLLNGTPMTECVAADVLEIAQGRFREVDSHGASRTNAVNSSNELTWKTRP